MAAYGTRAKALYETVLEGVVEAPPEFSIYFLSTQTAT
jgi:hypothetical protein